MKKRTRLILHVVNVDPYSEKDPYESYKIINKELKCHSEYLAKLPQVIACNKMDIPGAEENYSKFKKKVRKKVIPVSAITSNGLEELLDTLHKKLPKRSNS